MPLILLNLDTTTRFYMLDEVMLDGKQNRIYLSPRLNEYGRLRYPELLMQNIQNEQGSALTLALDLEEMCLKPCEIRVSAKGDIIPAAVPGNAAETLAEGEFNRYYIRALCRRVLEHTPGRLRVYRARYSRHPRMETEEKIGMYVEPIMLLADLRNSIGLETCLGIPAGPNSGLSVEIVDLE